MTTKTKRMPREIREQLRMLRAQWKAWKRGTVAELSHFDYCIGPCDEKCGNCEMCGMAAIRADRCAEIEAQAAEIKALWLLRSELGAAVIEEPGRAASCNV